jgi:tetratricopeptide (TPR) repeat protein
VYHDPAAITNRAAALCDLGRPAAARDALLPLLAREPEHAGAHHVLAHALLGLGDHAGALVAARTTAALLPDDARPHQLASRALTGLGRHREAVAAADRAVELDPGNSYCHRLAAVVRLNGDLYVRGALGMAAHAVELAPHEPLAHLVHGRAALAAGERRLARAAFLEALALDPNLAGARTHLAALTARRPGVLRPGLSRAATGFADVLATDPDQANNRDALTVVVRLFLMRALIVLLLALLACLYGGAAQTPSFSHLAVLALPGTAAILAYGLRFLAAVRRDVRRYLLRQLWTGRNRACTLVQVVALLLLAGAAVRPVLLAPAVCCAAAARPVLGRATPRR